MIGIEVLNKQIEKNKDSIEFYKQTLIAMEKEIEDVKNKISKFQNENKDLEATVTVLALMEKGS